MSLPCKRAAAALGFALVAQAGPAAAGFVTYDDRTAFETALVETRSDDLDAGLAQSFFSEAIRPDFVMVGEFYGCFSHGCGDTATNALRGFDYPAFVWIYEGDYSFTFDAPVSGFGFEYSPPAAGPESYDTAASIAIDGQAASAEHGFFGVVSDTPLSVFTLTVSGGAGYLLIDDLVYGAATASAVPLPAAGAALLAGLAALAGVARRPRRG